VRDDEHGSSVIQFWCPYEVSKLVLLLKTTTLLQFRAAPIQGRLHCRFSATGPGVSGMIEMEEDRHEEGCATPRKD
jgi:hypothetical protein